MTYSYPLRPEYDHVVVGMSQPIRSTRKYKTVEHWVEPPSVRPGYTEYPTNTSIPRPVIWGKKGLEAVNPSVQSAFQDEETGLLVWDVVKFEKWIATLSPSLTS